MVPAKPLGSNQKAKDDRSVMETNSSSIVSKRSVERLYYPEPHFFKYFVRKPRRRTSLINRGYWLRMHAIDVVVRQFLEESSSKTKVVLNLGCGYDPLAFQWLSKVKGTARHATFIDVDFPELIQRKSEIISATPQLQELLGDLATPRPSSSGIFLQSEQYYAVGCDLADTTRLGRILAHVVDLSKCLVLCTAEVSITYMNVEAADSLIGWAASQEDFRFCLLEQYLPDEADHPFSQKMIQHFNNLQTPLRNINVYPKLPDQAHRFSRAGWNSLSVRSLWQIFCDPNFVSHEQRIALDEVEPFDEWEELVLFASHYFLLIANNHSDSRLAPILPATVTSFPMRWGVNGKYIVRAPTSSELYPRRRFACIIDHSWNRPQLAHVSGLGPQTRIATADVYILEKETQVEITGDPVNRLDGSEITLPNNFEPRMCHTTSTTKPYGGDWLVAGGRKSPTEPLKDCWILQNQGWQRGNDLPISLYRHCQTQVCVTPGNESIPAILVYGGKTLQNTISSKWFLWRGPDGWVEAIVNNADLIPRFGAVMVSYEPCNGILLGGMTKGGTICHDFWLWSVTYDDKSGWTIGLTEQNVCKGESDFRALQYLYRFGASLERAYNSFLLIGGVADEIIPECYELVEISNVSESKREHAAFPEGRKCSPTERDESKGFCARPIISKLPSPRTLFIGHSSVFKDGQVAIIGGGAVCFSFGTHWNTTPISLAPLDSFDKESCEEGSQPFRKGLYLLRPLHAPDNQKSQASETSSYSFRAPTRIGSVSEGAPVVSAHAFLDALNGGQPVMSRSCDLGPCINEWQSLDTLKDRVGNDRVVVVHVSNDSHMDFQRCKQYLRSLASEDPTRRPANLAIDFPRLASDFHLFEEMKFLTDRIHSSVLRISGFVDMWLHYDVMANVLCQIRGSKRLILFPPSDVSYLVLPSGSSTSSIDCFSADFVNNPAFAQTQPQRVLLQPGDAIYIPPLWLHTASPCDGVSISVNVFFRSLDSGYAPGRDIYGNRDIQAYEKGRLDVEKITRSFEKFPSGMRRFYLDRLADELKANATKSQ